MKKILSITTLCLLSSSVFAQSAQTGLVIGATAGAASTTNYDSSGIVSNITKTQGGPITSVMIGYDLALNQHISVGFESGFGYGYALSSLKADGLDKSMLNQWYIPLLVAGKYTFTNGVNIFIKGGATYVHQQLTNMGAYFTPNINSSNSEFLPTIVVGAGYKFQNGINIGGQFSYLFGSTAKIRTSDSFHNNDVKVTASASLSAYISYTLPM
ncbi:outer membrane beta-barrel protein [Cysteiniphilum halobium]|uniref:outer membrane beta-barrel protein n=1 Tax=Cysteiniphilum halobium TaxID=2219059 RepID=UPI000E64C04D|nr:outer membrane beta-barrel protein [Cysteiniphilum halobium]